MVMEETLEFPLLIWQEGKAQPALEVSIDFLPKKFEGKWLGTVRGLTSDWVLQNSFKKSTTLWMWGCISVNLVSRHPDHPVPSWSDFIIQFGLPERFGVELDVALVSES
jgi:hypothetical protein